MHRAQCVAGGPSGEVSYARTKRQRKGGGGRSKRGVTSTAWHQATGKEGGQPPEQGSGEPPRPGANSTVSELGVRALGVAAVF